MTGRWRRSELTSCLLLLLAGTASAQDVNIVGLRTDPVMLYRDCKMDQTVVVTKQQFKGPWPARRDPNSSLYLHLVRDGVPYCVKAFAVSTDQVINVPKNAECGPQRGGPSPKAGSERGIGEACRGEFGPPAGTPGRSRAIDDFGGEAATPGVRPSR
jgi:hypothetical protein